MSLSLRAAVTTDVGLVRGNNEDSAFIGTRLVAVADGIGGMPAGELASDLVIGELAPLERRTDGDEPLPLLLDAATTANDKIRSMGETDPTTEGMGTTLTALLFSTDRTRLGLLHVGDSRCYLLRDAALTQLTKDDTFVQGLVDEGLLSAEDARAHPRRSLVTQAVQGHQFDATSEVLTPRANDRFMLCTDGLSDVVADEAIEWVLRSGTDPQNCTDRLVELALAAGGPDNVTVVVADVVLDDRVQ
jgi:PPM family protein phosphatase